MGGAIDGPGNVTSHAEFNFYCDPAAADRVLASGVPVTVIGLNVCDRVQVGPDRRGFEAGDSPGAALSTSLLDAWFLAHPGESFSMCDPLAVAVALDPSLVALRTAGVTVTTDGTERGHSAARYGGGSIDVAVDVDVERALAAIRELAFASIRQRRVK